MSHAPALGAERVYLHLDRPDDLAVAVATFDERIAPEHGEMQEYPDRHGRAPTLFRYTFGDGEQTTYSIPANRLTPRVRALLWQLAEAVEDAR